MSPRLDMPAPPPPRLTSAPHTEEGRAVRARLARRDRADWPWLLEGLREIARGLAPSFQDVCSADDVLGELALRTHEHWLEEWLTGPADVSVGVFLRDRLRDHLRDLRRRTERRGALLHGAVPGEALVETDAGARAALIASAPPSPEQALEARELRRELATASAQGSVILGLRAEGYEHAEIAAREGLSRQTVGRRLAAMLGVLAVLGAAGAAMLSMRGPTIEPIVPVTEPSAGAPGPVPDLDAATPDAGPETQSPAPVPTSVEDMDSASEDGGDPHEDPSGQEEGPPPALRIPAALEPHPAPELPSTPEASTPAFHLARAERLRAAIARCRREPGGSVRLELRPGQPEDLGVDGVERACVLMAVRRELARGRPDRPQTFRFSIDEDRAVHAEGGPPRAAAPAPPPAARPVTIDDLISGARR